MRYISEPSMLMADGGIMSPFNHWFLSPIHWDAPSGTSPETDKSRRKEKKYKVGYCRDIPA